MDNKDQQPVLSPGQPAAMPTPNPQPATTTQHLGTPTTPTVDKPQLDISDSVAASLLALNGIDSKPKTKLNLPIGLLVTIAIVIVLVVVASYLLGGLKPAQKSQSTSTGTSSQSQNNDGQINQDVKSCSNVVNAVSEC